MAVTSLRDVHERLAAGTVGLAEVSNPGLCFDRFVPRHTDRKETEVAWDAFVQSLESRPLLDPYRRYFSLREQTLAARPGVRLERFSTAGRLAFGLGDEGVSEIGLRLSRPYGLPVVPGSAQKGLVARYAAAVFGVTPGTSAFRGLFGEGGHTGQEGAVVFYDALWCPDSSEGPFVRDVTAVHHASYYQKEGAEAPSDADAPTPLVYLTSRGTFLFAMEGLAEAVAFAWQVLTMALADWGIGSRTLKGYGRFNTNVAPPAAEPAELWPAATVAAAAAAAPPPIASPAAAPAAPLTPATTAPATVRYLPSEGVFLVELPEGRGQTRRGQVGLFDDDATAEATKVRCRKKGFARAVVRFRQTGRLIEVEHIAPELPR